MSGTCKTCKYLGVFHPNGELVFRCEWLMTNHLPWSFRTRLTDLSPFIGKRHASPEWCAENPRSSAYIDGLGSDWTDAMNCRAWVSRA